MYKSSSPSSSHTTLRTSSSSTTASCTATSTSAMLFALTSARLLLMREEDAATTKLRARLRSVHRCLSLHIGIIDGVLFYDKVKKLEKVMVLVEGLWRRWDLVGGAYR